MEYSKAYVKRHFADASNRLSVSGGRTMVAVPVLQKTRQKEEPRLQRKFVTQLQAEEGKLPTPQRYVKPMQIQEADEQYLPQDSWHVAQQKQGQLKPTIQIKEGMALNNDKHENIAEALRVQTTDTSKTIQRKAIEQAGLELELKGASVYMQGKDKDDLVPVPDKYKIVDAKDWWIEIDSTYPELVTEPTASKATFFRWLSEGKEYLNRIHDIGYIKDQKEIPKQLADQKLPDWIIPYGREESKYIAKPQLSLQIKKGGMREFAEHALSGKIKHAMGRENKTDQTGFKDAGFDRISDEVSDAIKKMKDTPSVKTVVGKITEDSSDAGGLALITIVTMLHAARHQDPDNDNEYYKARFSIMPRTALSAMYDALTGEEKTKYRKLVDDWIANIYTFNDTAPPENKFKTKIQKETKQMENENRIGFQAIFISIINQEKRELKTMKSKKAANTDLIASDSTAGTTNTGLSVGNMEVSGTSSGIFELRKMPYTSIKGNEADVLYDETINAYGGM